MRNMKPSGVKGKKKAVSSNGSILTFFKRQKEQSKLQKQSRENWIESSKLAAQGTTTIKENQQSEPLESASTSSGNIPIENEEAFEVTVDNTVETDSACIKTKRRLSLKRKPDPVKLQADNTYETEQNSDCKIAANNNEVVDKSTSGPLPKQSKLVNEDAETNCCVSSGSYNEIVTGKEEYVSESTSTEINDFRHSNEGERSGVAQDSENPEEISSGFGDDSGDKTEEEFAVPYYLENFTLILNSVLNDAYYSYLFNDEDRDIIGKFFSLSENAQKLYVRLFGRILRWIRISKIVYPKIAPDLSPTLKELCDANLAMSEAEMDDLEDVLKSLPAPDIKTVAKSIKLSSSLKREAAIEAIIKHTESNNIGIFFVTKKTKSSGARGQDNALKRSVLQRSKRLVGRCYKLRKEPRSVFMRVLMLFSLHNTRLEDNDRDTGQQQIFQMLMSNIGRVKFPEYEICRETQIFKDRESLISFTAALQVETDIHEALERKGFEEALTIYENAVAVSESIHSDEDILKYDRTLPSFLRGYTTGAVYVRVLSYGVELLQFLKRYNEAVEQLYKLIQQNVYHLDYRGRWSERLALNLDFHLKKSDEALDVIKSSLADPQIRKGHRYALFQRAQKICTSSSSKLKKRWEEFETDVMFCVQQAPEMFIQARKQEVPGEFPIFISEDSYTADNQHVTFMKRVEDVALKHYEKQGYPQGIHGEGGTLSFFFALFFWDILFMPNIPDAFYNLFQTHPLDIYSEHFYERRKKEIDETLMTVRNSTCEALEATVRQKYETHKDTFCIGINWEMYTDVDQACGLLRCIGGQHLAAIFERFATDMRFTRSGLPDLTVWNPEDGKFKLVEVKGPGDRLSTKQILWLDYFIAIGVDAEVCYVKAIGAKKLLTK